MIYKMFIFNIIIPVSDDLILYYPDSYLHLQCAMMNGSSTTNWTYHEHDCHDNFTALCGMLLVYHSELF